MSARIDRGRVQLLTRTGLDWSEKYPSVSAALAQVTVESPYLDGELCGVGDDGLPSFSLTQAATDGQRGGPLPETRAEPPDQDHALVAQS